MVHHKRDVGRQMSTVNEVIWLISAGAKRVEHYYGSALVIKGRTIPFFTALSYCW